MAFRPRRTLLAALAPVLLAALPAPARASKLGPRLIVRRAIEGRRARPAGAAEPRLPVFLRVAPGVTLSSLRAAYPAGRFAGLSAGVATADLPGSVLDALENDPRVLAARAGQRARPNLEIVRSADTSGGLYLGVLRSSADLAGADGSGVVVGIVDSGLDFRHEDFRNGTASRVKYLWDQTDSGGSPGTTPSQGYGTEWTQAQLTSDIVNGTTLVRETDTEGHGTHVLSIAAGDGAATGNAVSSGTYVGLAPKADLVVVKTDFNTTHIADGVDYIVAKAAALGEPAVINLSLGLQIDPHDGTSAFDQRVGAVAASTPVVVAMGNDSGYAPHAEVASATNGQTLTFRVAVVGNTADAEIDFWTRSADSYAATVSFEGLSGSVSESAGSGTGSSPASLQGQTVYLENATSTNSSGDKEIYADVNNASNVSVSTIVVQLTCQSSGGCGRIDGFVDPAQEHTQFLDDAVPTLTMTSPATADNVFSVGAYVSRAQWTSIVGGPYCYTDQAGGCASDGYIADFSGWGPTRDGRSKPDVAAPGEAVAAALSSGTSPAPNNALVMPDGVHVVYEGTSMAAPVVTGLLADRLQAVPGRTVSDLRAILQGLARSDAAVTSLGSDSAYAFGSGKAVASPEPVSAPTGLSGAALGTSSITWSWSATTLSADAYDLRVASDTASLIASGVSPPYTMTGLQPGATFSLEVLGEGGGVEGPGTFLTTATYAEAPSAAPAATVYTTSVALTAAACAAPPSASACDGYAFQASTAADFSGTVYSTSVVARAQTTLTLSGLTGGASYYARSATLNPLGAPSYGPVTVFFTDSGLSAPLSPVLDQVSTGTVRFSWSQGANPSGLTYQVDVSTASDFSASTATATGTALEQTFAALAPDTSYYFRVRAYDGAGYGGYLSTGPAATLPVDPAAAPGLTYPTVGASTLRALWTAFGDPADTLFEAQLSTDAAFAALSDSVFAQTAQATFNGLSPNTLYYARVAAVARDGTVGSFVALPSTATLAQTPSGLTVSGLGQTGFTLTWSANGNPGGTYYRVQVATQVSFANAATDVKAPLLTETVTGLDSNQLYYAQVSAYNQLGALTPGASASTTTAVATPSAAADPVSTRTVSTFGFACSAGALAPGTQYQAQLSSSPSFAFGVLSSATYAASVAFSGLDANTTWYGRVRALSASSDPDGAYLAPAASGATLAVAPSGAALAEVSYSSLTVSWTALPASPQSATAEGFRVEAATSSDFGGTLAWVEVGAAASSATVTGLGQGAAYYARVGSLDWEGLADFAAALSTRTEVPPTSSGTVTADGLTLSVPPAFPQVRSATLRAPAGAFPPGTALSVTAAAGRDLSGARSNEAPGLLALGGGVAFELDAGGLQPAVPVVLTLSYDPATLPAGSDPRRLHVLRYDPGTAQWTIVPSEVDTTARTITAVLTHFSLYAPFFVTPGTDVSSVQVFPQPWEVGDPGSAYWAATLTFSGLPAGARVRLFTVPGEKVWEGTASGGGVLDWDGKTRFGRRAASGIYEAVFESGGSRKVRRVVLVR